MCSLTVPENQQSFQCPNNLLTCTVPKERREEIIKLVEKIVCSFRYKQIYTVVFCAIESRLFKVWQGAFHFVVYHIRHIKGLVSSII